MQSPTNTPYQKQHWIFRNRIGKEKKKKKPQKLRRKQAEFAIRTFDTDVPIREEDNTDCPGATAYLIAATTTTIDSTVIEPYKKEQPQGRALLLFENNDI